MSQPPDPATLAARQVSFLTHLLTLTTCNPKGQATQRLVARAEMVSSQPIT